MGADDAGVGAGAAVLEAAPPVAAPSVAGPPAGGAGVAETAWPPKTAPMIFPKMLIIHSLWEKTLREGFKALERPLSRPLARMAASRPGSWTDFISLG